MPRRSIDYSDLRFVLIGPPKAGTLWLAHAIRQHPDVFLTQETNYLSHHKRKGETHWTHYFADLATESCIGEYATSYFTFPNAPKILRDHNPALKLIVCIRDPMKRALSAIRHDYRWGHLGRHVDPMLAIAPDMLYGRYVGASLYAEHIDHYLEFFRGEQIYLFPFPTEAPDTQAALADLFAYLGVAPAGEYAVPPAQNVTAWPLSSAAHRARFYARRRTVRALARCIDPINVWLGRRLRPDVATPPVIEALAGRLAVGRTPSALRELIDAHGIRGAFFPEGWIGPETLSS